ncbi:MAG: hypothetical protein JNM17_00120 [Archangium sp.]|nr:hypothetical protein [Archangium sp.]
MISLSTVQRLLVISAFAWAIVPRWCGFAFAAAWIVLAIGSAQRTSRAKKLIAANPDALGKFPDETRAHLQKYALGYVWPEVADKWGTTWQLAGLLCVILALVFAGWALFTFSLWPLLLIIPLVAGVITGGSMARRLKIAERVKEDLKELKATHDAIVLVVKLKTGAGQWPPEPPPEGG